MRIGAYNTKRKKPMRVQIDIDDESLDEAIRQNLVWHIENAKQELNRSKKIKDPTISQKEELEYLSNLLPALNIVGEYFGVKKYEKKRNRNIR